MKKIIVFITLIISTLIFSSTFDDEIGRQRLSIRQAIYTNKVNSSSFIIADFESANIFIEELAKGNTNVRSLRLIFPNLKDIEDNLEKVSKKVDIIEIFILKNKSNVFKMQNRSYEEMLKIMNIERLKKINNLVVVAIDLPEKEQNNLYTDSFFKKPNETAVYRKYIGGSK